MFAHLAADLILGAAVMAALAVVLTLCSEADAFVAASPTMLRLPPRLVLLVVGPALDVKPPLQGIGRHDPARIMDNC